MTTDFHPISRLESRGQLHVYELDNIFSAYGIRSNLGLGIKFDLKFNLKFLVNPVSDFRRRADVARCPCHKVSPCRGCTNNEGSLIIIERISIRIVIGSKIL